MTDPADKRPFTAVLHQFVGMGDLVWHVEYFREIAARSRDGQVSVIASPTTFARELLGHEPWVREVIDFDRRPRRTEKRQGVHSGVPGLFRMGRDLRPYGFERIVLFSHHANRGLVAWWAGIPQRLGYGSSAVQRLFLTHGPYIDGYQGSAVPVHKDASSFMVAQGWCARPLVPQLRIRADALARMQTRLADLPTPRVALAIGSSEPFKQWGGANFAALTDHLTAQGLGVVLLGGPGERALGEEILAATRPDARAKVHLMTDGSVADTVAAMSLATVCVGNDTGATNIAAAVQTQTFVLLGPRPPLEHDPEHLHLLQAPQLAAITPKDVAGQVLSITSARMA